MASAASGAQLLVRICKTHLIEGYCVFGDDNGTATSFRRSYKLPALPSTRIDDATRGKCVCLVQGRRKSVLGAAKGAKCTAEWLLIAFGMHTSFAMARRMPPKEVTVETICPRRVG